MAEETQKKDQEEKKTIVIDTILEHCTQDSPFEDLRFIGNAVKSGGDKLICKIISGGQTNYSYKLHLETAPDKAVYAKLAFSYALWNPDRSQEYDLQRTQNEFDLMNRFAEIMGGSDKAPIATPYFCVDVQDMKLLVTQWASTDEQWGNQFIDGQVDERLAPKVAEAFATLNMSKVEDPMFNDNVRPCMRGMFQISKSIFGQLIEADGPASDKFVELGKEIGQEQYDRMIQLMDDEYMKREELSHSDSQAFNILVEKKPPITELRKFGPKGSFVICDWEMAFVGPVGRDLGIVQTWPIACALCHAVQGHKLEAYGILEFCSQYSGHYLKFMRETGGKDDTYLRKAFLGSIKWVPLYLVVALYQLGLNSDFLPLDGVPEEDAVKAKGAIGWLGLELMEWGYLEDDDPSATLDDLRVRYKSMLEDAVEMLLKVPPTGRPVRPRRNSVLREKGRRISDAFAADEAIRRLSVASQDNKMKRASIYELGASEVFFEDADIYL